MIVKEQEKVITAMKRVIKIFTASEQNIRPHFILTGESGSGKSYAIKNLAEEHDLNYVEINGAQLTKEGTAGNSLSKALSPLINANGRPTICFVDEFDKLFISGNSNSDLAHETTNGVQNEFLKVLESDIATVYGDYGKYVNASVENVLFIFAGAFNGEKNITLDKLREFGIKTEFLGRVGLVYNLERLSLDSLLMILDKSDLLAEYLELFEDIEKEDVIEAIGAVITKSYENNTLGARLITSLIHQYFILGGKLETDTIEKTTFTKKLKL